MSHHNNKILRAEVLRLREEVYRKDRLIERMGDKMVAMAECLSRCAEKKVLPPLSHSNPHLEIPCDPPEAT